MIERLIELLTRLVVAIETIAAAGAFKMPVASTEPTNMAGEQGVTPPAQTSVIPQPSVQTPPVQTPPVQTPPVQTPPAQTPPAQTPPAAGGWDPAAAEIQGSYRAKDKKEAIDATIAELGIQAAKSWTYAKKHRAILDHVAQFGAAQAMSWETFENTVRSMAAESTEKRDAIFTAVQEIEGHQVVAKANIQPQHYQSILDRASQILTVAGTSQTPAEGAPIITGGAAATTPELPINQPTGAPVSYTPGSPVTNVEELQAYARYLILQGVAPAAIPEAIAHIAPGVTYVQPDRLPEAVQALNNLASTLQR